MKKQNKDFIELRDAWVIHAINENRKNFRRKFLIGKFDIGFLRKINPRKVLAITVVTINTPLPTASIVTNPIIYNKIMKFNTNKFKQKINCIKMRFM